MERPMGKVEAENLKIVNRTLSISMCVFLIWSKGHKHGMKTILKQNLLHSLGTFRSFTRLPKKFKNYTLALIQ